MLGWKGSWACVAYESYNDTALGWVNADYLSKEPAQKSTKYYVHASGGLNMRSRPSTTGDRLLTIPEGEIVYAQAYCDDWVFVSYNGWYGWVSGDYISTSASKPAKPQQGNQGSSGGYTTADIEAAIAEAKTYPGIYYVRVWLNSGHLEVGDDIMKVLVGGDIRERTIDGLIKLVRTIKTTCVVEDEVRG